MARSLESEIRRVNFNLLWCNTLLLLAALGLADLPVILGVARTGEAVFWYAAAAPLALLSLWNLVKWAQRRDFESHPFLEKLKGLGPGVPDAVAHDLERTQDFLGLSLGRNWLLKSGFFKLELEALADAVWAYRRVSYAEYLFYSQAVVHFRSGKSLAGNKSAKSDQVDLFLGQLSQAVPWIMMGENDAMAKLWSKDRQNFVSQVDQRRKALEGQRRRTVVPESPG